MRYLIDLGIVAVLAAAAICFMRYEVNPSPYYYDEADYMFAASRGFAANWTDTPAFTPLDFVRVGLGRGRDPSQRAGLSQWIRESGDMNSYRHWHGPVYYYLLIAANAPMRSEQGARGLARFLVVLGIALIYFGTRWALVDDSRLPALVASAMFALDSPVLVSTEIAPHVLFSIICVASVLCVARVFATGERRYWYAALALAGIAFCTMELSFALICAIAICGWLERGRLRPDWPLAAGSAIAFLAPILALWPASLYKLTFLKSFMGMAYLAVFRKGAWGGMTFTEAWVNRFYFSPFAWCLIALAVVLFIRSQSRRRIALPFLVFGIVMLAAVLRVNDSLPRYTLLYLTPLVVFAGWIIGDRIAIMSSGNRVIALMVVFGGLLGDAATHAKREPIPLDKRPSELVATIRSEGLTDKALLVPQYDVPMLHYYFPGSRLRGYANSAEIASEISASRFDAVVEAGYPLRIHAIQSKPR